MENYNNSFFENQENKNGMVLDFYIMKIKNNVG